MKPRILLLGLLAIACSSVLSGCISLRSVDAAKQGPVGVVRISATVCASGHANSKNEPCSEGQTAQDDKTTRALLGFLVPAGTRGPTSFDAVVDGATELGLTFVPSAGYTQRLTADHAAPTGFAWIGYQSNRINYRASSGPQEFSVAADFQVPQGADGAPFDGPFRAKVVAGEGANPAECDHCYDSVRPGGAPNDITSVLSAAVSDAGVLGGGAVTAARGDTASVPFTFAYRGDDPGSAFAITAGTDLPGATATAATATLQPAGTSDAPVAVAVPIPADAAPGPYAVTLTAVLGGQTRRQTRTLVVAGAPENDERPQIAGAQQEGSVLTARDGSWTGTPAPELARRWLRCGATGAACSAIDGATGDTYRLTGADVGRTLRLRVSATNVGGSTDADSAPTGTIVALPPVAAPVPPDTAAPALTLSGLPKTVKRKAFLRGLTVTVSRDEAAALDAALLGSARKVKLARASAFQVILGSARVARGTGVATLKLRPAKRLVGRARRFKARVEVSGTDAAGNRATVAQTIRVR